jgi:DNA-binding LacI/PurR family transcriptional regulator
MYVSLKDVAAHAGTSFHTASTAQFGVVSDKTRGCTHVARELGFLPNALANASRTWRCVTS